MVNRVKFSNTHFFGPLLLGRTTEAQFFFCRCADADLGRPGLWLHSEEGGGKAILKQLEMASWQEIVVP